MAVTKSIILNDDLIEMINESAGDNHRSFSQECAYRLDKSFKGGRAPVATVEGGKLLFDPVNGGDDGEDEGAMVCGTGSEDLG